MVIAPRTVRYRRERWQLADGGVLVAALPDDVSGSHFGADLRRSTSSFLVRTNTEITKNESEIRYGKSTTRSNVTKKHRKTTWPIVYACGSVTSSPKSPDIDRSTKRSNESMQTKKNFCSCSIDQRYRSTIMRANATYVSTSSAEKQAPEPEAQGDCITPPPAVEI